jgi:signal transduction histidine kinase
VACWLLFRRSAARAAAANAGIAESQAALGAARLQIHNFADSQARFVGNLALEIEAPLATGRVHADLLLAGSNEPAVVQRYARSVAEDMRHLACLVESFLRLARPFAQEDLSHHIPVVIHDVVLQAVRRCQSLAKARDVTVVPMLAESSTGTAVEVLGDAVLLEAMMENLVRHAVLAAPRASRVDLHVRVQGDEIVLSVRDQGSKSDDEYLASVFDGFSQVPSPPRPVAGTGLSLAIAKRVAEHHRGTISLRNVAVGGCEFEVQLPRWRADEPAAGLAAAAP